jgi:O-antigen/teichoic acid export membrane protein
VAWSLAAAVLSQGSTFLVSIVLARMLGRGEFGKFALVQGSMMALANMAQLATGYTATKYVAEFRAQQKSRAGGIAALCLLISASTAGATAVIMLALAEPLSQSVFKAVELASGMRWGSAYMFFMALSVCQIGILAGLESFRGTALASAVASGGYAAACIGLAFFVGLKGAFMGLALGGLVRYAVYQHQLRRAAKAQDIHLRIAKSHVEAAVLLTFGIPAALSGCIMACTTWTTSVILTSSAGGFDEMAIFTAANSFRLLTLFLPNVVNNVALALLNHALGHRSEETYRRGFRYSLGLIALTTTVAAALFAVAARPLLGFFGRDFRGGSQVMVLLLASTIFEGLGTALYQLVQSRGRMWLSLLGIVVPRETTLVVCALLLTRYSGAEGLATAYLVASAVGLFATVGAVVRISAALPVLRELWKPELPRRPNPR